MTLPAALEKALSRPASYLPVRTVEDLETAEWVPRGPFPNNPTLTGSALEGIRYERKVGRALMRLGLPCRNGPWIRFRDANGPGHARPDFVLTADRPLLVEVKLTLWPQAFDQTLKLYSPLVEHILGVRPLPVIVFRNPGCLSDCDRRGFTLVPGSLRAVLSDRSPGFLIHWNPSLGDLDA